MDASDVSGVITIDGPPVTATTTIPGQDVRLSFSVIANQQITLQVTSVTNPSAGIAILGPTGEPLPSAALDITNNPAGQVFFLDQQILPVTGRYTLRVLHSGNSVGSETLQLNSAQDFLSPIVPGGDPVRVPSNGDTIVGQNGRLTFTASAGQKVSANISNGTFAGNACLLWIKDPAGSFVTSGWRCGLGATTFVDTVTLASAGQYTVFVDPQQKATGNTTVQLNDASDATGTISVDGSPVTISTTVQGQDARLSFGGTAGQSVRLQVTGVTNPSASVFLLKPDGTQQASMSGSNSPGQTFFMDAQPLAISGTYTLWVRHNNANIGGETFQLNSVPPDFTAPIIIGGPAVRVPNTGDTAIRQNGILTFNASAGQKVSMNISSGTYIPYT
ncbi:MAG: hypothetical protein ACRD4I_11310, partial [Candidatus Angelobacter sp.]